MISFALIGILIAVGTGIATFLFLAIGLPEIPAEMMDAILWVIDFLSNGILAFKYVFHFNAAANVMFVFMTTLITFRYVGLPLWRLTMFIVRKIPGLN